MARLRGSPYQPVVRRLCEIADPHRMQAQRDGDSSVELARRPAPRQSCAADDPCRTYEVGPSPLVPLSPLAAGTIASVKRFADTDLITPGARSKRTGKTAPISGWSKSWPRLLKIAEEHGLRRRPALHDLRKTFRSHLARLSVADRVAELMLNHAPQDRLVGIYDRHDYLAEKVEAATKWADAVSAALTEPAVTLASVVTLRPAAKIRRKLASGATAR